MLRNIAIGSIKIAVLACAAFSSASAQTPGSAKTPWDSVGRILGTAPTPNTGYTRFNFPRRDITLKIGDVTVSPALALGSWAGFSGEPSAATMMGDLVLLGAEVKPVLAELARQNLAITAVHNHLAGESPAITYVHFHGDGDAFDLARRLDRALAKSATPRPVAAAAPQAATIDTATIFSTLGIRGRANGNVAQLSTVLVPGEVQMHGKAVNAGMGYATPINIQMVDARRAVATGDFTVLGSRVDAVTRALAINGIAATAVHSHLIDEQPSLRYIHFWADAPLPDVLRGLKAALDAGRAK